MKRYVGFSTSIVLCVGLVFTQIGCQSGWKISNPFASHPRASSAETPEELDALGEVDELTPPPENYTVGDASKSDRSESLAQQGKYEVEDKASDVEKLESENRAIAEKADSYKSQGSYQVADYSQSYQTEAAPATGDYAAQSPASSQPYAQTNPATTQQYTAANQVDQYSQQSYAQTNQTPVQTTSQEYAQAPVSSGFQAYSAPGVGVDATSNAQFNNQYATAQNAVPYNANNVAVNNVPVNNVAVNNVAVNNAVTPSNVGTDVPSTDFPGTPAFAENSFPTSDSSFPAVQNMQVAQNTNASPMGEYPNASFGAAPSSSQPIHVAMNPESSVVTGATPANSQPATYSTGATTDSDPYSDVYYAPQTASSGAGFAPGSASGLY